jgi:hypothetical protein
VTPVATVEQAPLDAGLGPAAVFEPGGTLEDSVLRAWENLLLEGHASCLVCGAEAEPGTDCPSCGSQLG